MKNVPQEDKNPAESVGLGVSAGLIAVSGRVGAAGATKIRRNSGVEGAEARMGTLEAGKRSKVVTKASVARWRKEKDVSELSPKAQLSALYSAKREAGLIDVKFLVGSIDEASFDEVAQEVLRLEDALSRGAFKVRRFNDKKN